jgi:DNA-binding NtrC family response regulator
LLRLRDRLAHWHRIEQLDSTAPAMQRVAEQVRLAARLEEPIWLLGERGTGKQFTARMIHQLSIRSQASFVTLSCHLPAATLEHLLFGTPGLLHAPQVGTLYLQEPQHLSPQLQAQLCQGLQQRTAASTAAAGPRLLVGSSGDPAENVRQQHLLETLYARCSVLTVALPPLRERRADIPALAERLLARAAATVPATITGLTPLVQNILQAAPWPGNVAELYQVLRSACGRARGPLLEVSDLPWYVRNEPKPSSPRTVPLDAVLEQVERRMLLLALQWSRQFRGKEMRPSKSKAAELLQMNRDRLHRRLIALGLETPEEGE